MSKEPRLFYPKPAADQTWFDYEGEVVNILGVASDGSYPVSYEWSDGTRGACELSMPDFEPTPETWVAHVREVAASAREEADILRVALKDADLETKALRANLATLGIELSKAREGWARACTERDDAREEAYRECEAIVSDCRQNGETDLRSILHAIAFARRDAVSAATPGTAEPPRESKP